MASSVFRDFDEYDGLDRRGANKSKGESTTETSKYTYKFTPKFRLSTKNNPMCGIGLPQWLSILRNRWRQIEWTVYWPRLLFISYMSVLNSVMGLVEHLLYGRTIEQATIHPNPVFILGHPRTGTTLAHSLLGLDSEQFTYCSTFCAGFPSCFLWFESIGKVLFKGVIDDTRPMDNVKLDFDLPQEDELATNVISAGTSPYMPLFFMKQEPEFRPFYAFDDRGDGDASSDEWLEASAMARARKTWIDSFLYLLRKLTVRAENERTSSSGEGPRRLILKSPVHTARIGLMNQLFPEAQFIYIHRNPYDVFRSAAHMADTTYWYTYLNTPSDEDITEFILRQYEILYDRYEEGRTQILSAELSSASGESAGDASDHQQPAKRLVEISYDELSKRPMETAQRIYQELGWKWTARCQERLATELGGDDFKTYKKNAHIPLDPALKKVINERWGPSFDRFGYTKDE